MERGAEGTFGHTGIAVNHAAEVLKSGRSIADCLEKPPLLVKQGQ
jgi:hypothetical protein